MRLIHTTKLELVEFIDLKSPPYAILSHTWEGSEISYADFKAYTTSGGVPDDSKIARCCVLAASEGWQFLWVDTCCIDKSSSAELTESINSMWNWYRNAAVCYVYLADISLKAANQNKPTKKFGSSRWISRGWTLQELLAPEAVVFYDQDWFEIGSKASLKDNISKASNIAPDYLFDAMDASVAAKMSWASNRTTTRIEDIAYCLLGLFDVNMPLLYGEGEKAFTRLQHEIIQSSPDQSIFAWKSPYQSWMDYCNLLAPVPVCFQDSGDIIPLAHGSLDRNAFLPRNYGLAVELHVAKMRHFSGCNHSCDQWVAPLACCRSSESHAPSVLLFCEGKMDKLSLRSYVDKLDSLDCLEYHSDTYWLLPLASDPVGQPFEQKAFYFPMKSFPRLPPRMWLRETNLGAVKHWISFTAAAIGEFTSTYPPFT